MICTTIRKGVDCPFMTEKGCSYKGGRCYAIVEECSGCNRAAEFESGWYCSVAPEPAIKWKLGNCNMATHVQAAVAETKAKINPIKASKRSSGGGRKKK